ncbi:hypothetical protein ACP70R_027743 [Stipagrostis hirtigluma subsp. patula]
MQPITAQRSATWPITAQSIQGVDTEHPEHGKKRRSVCWTREGGYRSEARRTEAEARAEPGRATKARTDMAATAYSTALLGGARLPAAGAAVPSSVLILPRRNLSPLRLQGENRLSDAPRLSVLRVKASSDDTSTSAASGDELIEDLKAKWDAVENKSTVLTYAGGAIVAVWLSSVIVGAVNSVPLLPKLMELVGLGYTGWFVYRYLLFKESRKELSKDIESIKKKIAGTE